MENRRMDKMPCLPPQVLLVDDEPAWLRGMSLALERHAGIDNCIQCQESLKVMEILAAHEISVVLLDITMPKMTGEELLEQIQESYPALPVIIITGRNQIDIAVRCMKLGAFDFYIKTMEMERIIAGVVRALEHSRLQNETRRLRENYFKKELDHPALFADIITSSPRMFSIFRYVEAISSSPEAVLITGESGVGKDLVARAVHDVSRPKAPLVAVNVAGLDETAFTDTLFGHVRGAFTGADRKREGMVARAAGGTLFLDEIGDLSLSCQTKLLRLLQEGDFYPLGSDTPARCSARLVFATNQDLEKKQKSGAFRKDLYYRLCAHRIEVPPLRERLEDLPELISFFVKCASREQGKRCPDPGPELCNALKEYSFPGNVRELRAMVYEMVSLYKEGPLSLSQVAREDVLPEAVRTLEQRSPGADKILFPPELPTIKETIDQLVDEAMQRTSGNQTRASRLLGISRPALSKRLKNKDEDPPDMG